LGRYTSVADNTENVPALSKNLAFQCSDRLLFNENLSKYSNNIVGIPNHGVVSIGENVYEAFEHVERLEHISQIVMMSKIKA
jgi:L-fuculose-phosphate aldolase